QHTRDGREGGGGMRRDGRIGFAVVGAGHIAQARVLPAFQNTTQARLSAIVSGHPKKRHELGRRWKVPTYDYADFEECLARPDVDAVYVATPNTEHVRFTELAARHGCNVLCEKPMAITEEDCLRMIRACRDADVRLMIAYRLHYEPVHLRLVRL